MEKVVKLITKYEQIAEIIEKKIINGDYLLGNKIPSERKIAEEYGVSHMTVNKALSLLVAKGIIKRVHGNGTFIVGEGNFISSKIVTIVIYSDIQNHPLFYPLLPEALQSEGFFPVILNTNASDTYEKFAKIMEQKPKGAIVEPNSLIMREINKLGKYENITLINLPLFTFAKRNLNIIYFDYFKAGYVGLETLILHNKKRPLILTFERRPNNLTDLFLKGCESVLKNYKLDEFYYVDTNKMSEVDYEKIFIEKHFDSILSLGDFRIISVLKAFQKLGLKVPDDIFIIGTYNTPWAEIYGITSISINQKEIIDEAILCIKENRKGYVKRIEPYIVFRNSCPKIERGE
jgi:DNA-binding LacI/PurR family transcriptional regulator